MVRNRRAVFVDRHGVALVDHLARLHHLLIGHAGQLFDVALVKLLDIFGIGFEAMHIAVDVVFVNPSLLDEDICHAHRQGAIRSRIRTQVQVAHLFHGRSNHRVDNDDLHSLFAALFCALRLQITRIIGIERPAEKQVAVLHVRSCQLSYRCFPRHPSCGHAGAGLGAIVHGAKGVGKPPQPRTIPLVVSSKESHRIGSVLLFDLTKAVGNLPVCLLPTDRNKLSFSALSNSFERRQNAILPIGKLSACQSFGAKVSLISRMFVHALQFQHLSILHIRIDAAIKGRAADSTHGMFDFNSRLRTGNLCF